MIFKSESNSKLNPSRDLEDKKHDSPMISSDRGRTTRRKFESRNASDSIRINFEFGSNSNLSSELQDEKHDSPMISSDRGRRTRRKLEP
jgi:hypothetical protein